MRKTIHTAGAVYQLNTSKKKCCLLYLAGKLYYHCEKDMHFDVFLTSEDEVVLSRTPSSSSLGEITQRCVMIGTE